MATTPDSPEHHRAAEQTESLAELSDPERIEVLRVRANARRATGEIPDRFGARIDQHFNKILQHVRPDDDVDDPLVAAAASLSSPSHAQPRTLDGNSRTKKSFDRLGLWLDRGERERATSLERTVLVLIERVRELERREHRMTVLADRVDQLELKVRELQHNRQTTSTEELELDELELDDHDLDDDDLDELELELELELDELDDDELDDHNDDESEPGPSRGR